MIDIQKWIDRVSNELVLQKECCLETVKMTFTRRELIELQIVFNILIELEKQLKDGVTVSE